MPVFSHQDTKAHKKYTLRKAKKISVFVPLLQKLMGLTG